MGRRSAGPFLFFRGKASLQTPRCPSPQPSPRKREREHHSPSEVVGARLARDLASIVQGAPGKSAGRERSKRSEEHTSELQSLMRISYAVFCLKKKKKNTLQQPQRYNVSNTPISTTRHTKEIDK